MSIIKQGFESADLDVPVVLPTLNLDFANSQSLDKRITFTRGSIGTRVNRNGLIETIPANLPRFDFDPISGECRGLLIEESRQNLLTYSNGFDDASWTKQSSSVISNSTTSPDGSSNAYFLLENATKAQRWLNRNASGITASSNITASVYVKFYSLNRRFALQLTDAPSGGSNYSEVTIRSSGQISITSSNFTNTIASVSSLFNGWYRVSLSITTSTVTTLTVRLMLIDNVGSQNYQGDGTSGIYIWGAQLEAGAFPTSYIPTTASTVTRSADVPTMTGTNFSSWYNQTESTIFCKFNAYNNIGAGQKNIIDIRGSAALGLNLVQLQLNYISATSQHIYHNLYQNGVNFADYFALLYTTGPTKNIMRYKDLDTFVASKDGNIRSNTSRNKKIPLTKNMDSLTFGTFNGAISKFAYYPKALNDAEIQYLTQ